MRRAIPFVALITAVLVPSVCAQERLSEIVARIKPSVVTVISEQESNRKVEFGTGFFVSPSFKEVIKPDESVASFANRIRKATGEYYDRKDIDLVGRMLQRYPEYRKSVSFSGQIQNLASDILVNKGIISAGTFVITNWHVVDGAESIKIKTYDKQVFSVVTIVAISKSSDIVLLKVDAQSNKFHSLTLSADYPEQGDDIFVIGNPLGILEGSLSKGIISATRDLPNIGEVLQITAPVSQGNSGSPVFNINGEVVGVVTFMLSNGQDLNFAVQKRILERILFPGDPARLYTKD